MAIVVGDPCYKLVQGTGLPNGRDHQAPVLNLECDDIPASIRASRARLTGSRIAKPLPPRLTRDRIPIFLIRHGLKTFGYTDAR